ncbi:MAG: hypothetical protein LBJ89_01805, partial [Holosporales bacterium]|nr:hypothetical protein [Holosporales bacterium]
MVESLYVILVAVISCSSICAFNKFSDDFDISESSDSEEIPKISFRLNTAKGLVTLNRNELVDLIKVMADDLREFCSNNKLLVTAPQEFISHAMDCHD